LRLISRRGLNRLTQNIELALPIIDDAFRYILSLAAGPIADYVLLTA
jgi:hypothetical protein